MRLLALLAVAVGLALGSAAYAQEVKVGAAASLTNVLEALGKAWSESGGGRMVGTYAASSALARQIEQGAPIDVFLSADLEWMDYLASKGLIESGTRKTVAANTLVLIAPADKAQAVVLEKGMDLKANY